jgi:hypothetical protein
MAQEIQQNLDYSQEGLQFLANNGGPIPGESLTNSPDSPFPWEGETTFNELTPAIDAVFLELTEPETFHTLMDAINKDIPVGDLAQIILYAGFTKGFWNPDLMLLLIEPVMYMLLALSEKAGIEDPVIYRGEEEEADDPEDQLEGLEKAIEVAKDKIIPKIKKGYMPRKIEEKIEEFVPPEEPSLLAPSTEERPQLSLLDKEEI